MDTFPLAAGSALSILATVGDSNGVPQPYTTPPTLSATVWPGGNRAASFAVAAAWLDLGAGQVRLSITAAQSATLASGRYRGMLVVFDPDDGPVVAYEWLVDVATAAGVAAEPPSYCTYDDLLAYGRSWLPNLQSDGDEAGFAVERGRARSWLDDLILSRCPARAGAWNVPGTPGYNSFAGLMFGGSATPNIYLRSLLDANLLFARGWVVEATAKKALALVCQAQVGPTEGADQFRRLGNRYAAEALAIAGSSVAEIGYPAAGQVVGGIAWNSAPPTAFGESYPMMAINLGAGSLR